MTVSTRAAAWTIICATAVGGCSPTSPSPQAGPDAPFGFPAHAPSPIGPHLAGTVHDAASTPVGGVLIQAWSGPEAYATSDGAGHFALRVARLEDYGPADVFHASKAGYLSETRTLGSGLTFVLVPVAPPD
jgi:hypothetical protein